MQRGKNKKSILDKIKMKLKEDIFLKSNLLHKIYNQNIKFLSDAYLLGYDDAIDNTLELISPFLICLEELSIQPYSDSDFKSLLETLQKWAKKVLSQYEDGKT